MRREESPKPLGSDITRYNFYIATDAAGPGDADGDEFNNSRANLLKLCRAHHRLVDNGKIDPRDPKMPEFRIDGSGKRRYG